MYVGSVMKPTLYAVLAVKCTTCPDDGLFTIPTTDKKSSYRPVADGRRCRSLRQKQPKKLFDRYKTSGTDGCHHLNLVVSIFKVRFIALWQTKSQAYVDDNKYSSLHEGYLEVQRMLGTTASSHPFPVFVQSVKPREPGKYTIASGEAGLHDARSSECFEAFLTKL
jgi:hypothetical protein